MKKIFLFILTIFSLITLSNAVDLNNISFSDETFYTGSVTHIKVLELSNGDLAVGYIRSNAIYLKICDLDGSNCGSEVATVGAATMNSFDMFEDMTNNKIILSYGTNTAARFGVRNLDGTYFSGTFAINTGNSDYISTTQTNTTHFAVVYRDNADSSRGKVIICALDGSGCNTETTLETSATEYLRVLKTSNNKIAIAYDYDTGGVFNGKINVRNLDGTASSTGTFNTADTNYIDIVEGSDNKLKLVYQDGGNSFYSTFRSCDLDGSNCGSEVVFDSNPSSFFSLIEANDLLFVSFRNGSNNDGGVINFNLSGGEISSFSTFNTNNIRYIDSLYSTSNNLVIGYNENFAFGKFAVSESLAPSPVMSTNIQPYYNSSNIFITVTNDGIINASQTLEMFYSLDGASNVSLGNTTNVTFELTGLNDSLHTIDFYLVSDQGNSSLEQSFTIDTVNPVLNVNLPAEYNFLLGFNFSNYITVTDTNLDTCTVTIGGEPSTTCTDSSYDFTTNGNKDINVTATDLAGNSVSVSTNMLINQFVYVYFINNVTLNPIQDYTLGGITVTGQEYKQKYFDIYTGTQNLELTFVKDGYKTKNVTINMLNNQTINQTFDATFQNLFIKAFDGETFLPLNFDLVLQNGNITSFTNLTVFNDSYPNIPLGDIKITVSKEGYSNGVVYTTIAGQSAIEFNIYLTPENVSNIIAFNVKDFNDNSFLGDVLIEARQIINNSEVTVQQTLTGSNGVAYLNLDPTKDYEFVFTKDGYVMSNINAVPGVLTYTVKLKSETAVYEYLDDITLRINPRTDIIYGGDEVNFKAFISGTALTLTNISITDNFGNVLYVDSSTNPTGTTFEFTKQFLNDTNISKVTMNIGYIVDGNIKNTIRIFNVFSLADSGIKDFDDFGNENDEEAKLFRFFIIITTFAAFIILGTRNQQTRDYVSLITIFPLIMFTYVGWIPYLYSTIMFLAMIVFFMGGNKR